MYNNCDIDFHFLLIINLSDNDFRCVHIDNPCQYVHI